MDGVITPAGETALFPLKLPPALAGETEMVYGANVLHISGIAEIVGVGGLNMVTVICWVRGQLMKVGVTTVE
jgi:hypothetical protein